jgi:hypothetical protein
MPKIKYRCKHITCRNPKCHEGVLDMDDTHLERLRSASSSSSEMKSPKNVCKIGFTQDFIILAIDKQEVESVDGKQIEQEISQLQRQLSIMREKHRVEEEVIEIAIKRKLEVLRKENKNEV